MPAMLALLLILAVSRDRWLPPIGRFLVVADPIRPDDAVVPLAGERIRIDYAVGLFKAGMARRFALTDMWVPDPHPRVSYLQSVQDQAMQQGIPANRIQIVPSVAASTYREALNLRRFAQSQGWHTLAVVTSPYHTRRAQLILDDVFRGTNITVMIWPVAGHWYNAETWWKDGRGRAAVASEYAKLALYLLGYHTLDSR